LRLQPAAGTGVGEGAGAGGSDRASRSRKGRLHHPRRGEASLTAERATFYFDLGSPYAYLTAERISGLFTDAELEQPEWQPILLGGLFKRFGRDSWANGPGREDGIAEVERRAAELSLPALV